MKQEHVDKFQSLTDTLIHVFVHLQASIEEGVYQDIKYTAMTPQQAMCMMERIQGELNNLASLPYAITKHFVELNQKKED